MESIVDKLVSDAYRYRVLHRFTQDEMAKLLGVSRNSYNAIETKRGEPSKKTRLRLEHLLYNDERSH